MLATKPERALADVAAKPVGEIKGIVVSHLTGNFGNAEVCQAKQLAGVLHAPLLQKLLRRASSLFLEQMRQA